uniref:RNA-directed DNA polymerase, eukaryota, nucleotide-binding alpha-beta plait domain protein n=1 Tax=Tanacetum cinerariifolium TaxID=118510 RepID=A0A6L2N9Y5_TANCI|nr:RNA-directed DNA polymerase, eukaryota, nucleotide-binding alpha-beta plait domain protein [Tanacetum cinerariifolium]
MYPHGHPSVWKSCSKKGYEHDHDIVVEKSDAEWELIDCLKEFDANIVDKNYGKIEASSLVCKGISHHKGLRSSKVETNFTDLLEVCQGYGTVVDVYIPNRKSKSGKRFAFVRFIKVENVDRLVGNLCTLWIGRMHLHANIVRFEHSLIHSSRPTNPIRSDNAGAPSFASALK